MRHVALITGGSRGLGATLAAFLAAQDYDLVLTSRHSDELDAAARALSHYGGRVLPIAGDVAEEDHRQKLIAAAWDLGGLDLLVNNASDLGPTPLPALADYPLDQLTRVLAVNVVAPLGLVQTALPLLQKRQGLVVNLSSDAALGGYPGWGGYGASKAALDLISLTLANELKEHGVAVVSVDPGDMRTAMHQAAFPGADISDRPLPEATIPFFAWLFGQEHGVVSSRRYRAQAAQWEIAA
ncbi:Short-chain dehydrogenase [Rhizobiales bacterium GAS113]|jgi:NAD(P)-dependent dehydrogenase (short-subunit alcohol dehydrogenase family)|nr:Short-chain dehydrogenase [Rhizobiales bacterium GAS113]SEC36114.1 Short-chain dehydrogenase [Rhizobiales bacterium GAS188]